MVQGPYKKGCAHDMKSQKKRDRKKKACNSVVGKPTFKEVDLFTDALIRFADKTGRATWVAANEKENAKETSHRGAALN